MPKRAFLTVKDSLSLLKVRHRRVQKFQLVTKLHISTILYSSDAEDFLRKPRQPVILSKISRPNRVKVAIGTKNKALKFSKKIQNSLWRTKLVAWAPCFVTVKIIIIDTSQYCTGINKMAFQANCTDLTYSTYHDVCNGVYNLFDACVFSYIITHFMYVNRAEHLFVLQFPSFFSFRLLFVVSGIVHHLHF